MPHPPSYIAIFLNPAIKHWNLQPLLMKAAALSTTSHSHHSNITKQHGYFITHQPQQQISLQQSNLVNNYIELLTQHVRRLLGTHQWQSALLMVGVPVTQDWI